MIQSFYSGADEYAAQFGTLPSKPAAEEDKVGLGQYQRQIQGSQPTKTQTLNQALQQGQDHQSLSTTVHHAPVIQREHQLQQPTYLIVDSVHPTTEVLCSSLRTVLSHTTVPARFRCVVRIIDILPRDPGNPWAMIQPFCQFCQLCSCDSQCIIPPPPAAHGDLPPPTGQGQGAAARGGRSGGGFDAMLCTHCHGTIHEWVYRATFLLQDEFGTQLPAILYREDGEDFFDGIKASDLRHDRARLMKLRTTLESLLGQSRHTSRSSNLGMTAQPEAPCGQYLANLCLKSYYVPTQGRESVTKGQQKVMYRIFGSRMVGQYGSAQVEAKPLDKASLAALLHGSRESAP